MRRALLLLLVLCLWHSPVLARDVGNLREALIYSQNLVDSGDFSEALDYLKRATNKFPEDDRLLTLYGQALYESDDLDEAEARFRDALQINPQNVIAKNYVEVIRAIRDAQKDPLTLILESVAWDKAGDVVVLAVGFFLGSLMSGALNNFNARRHVGRSKRLFLIGQYDDFADSLEIQLGENNLRHLRESLAFMLEHKSLEESKDILTRYVNSEDNLGTLVRMISLHESRNA